MNYDQQEHEYMELKSQMHAERKFDRFIDEINSKVQARYGLSIDDFPDFDFWGYYDETAEEGTTGWENMVEGAFEDYRYDLEAEHKDFF